MPVEYIPRTRELYSGYTPYRWVVNADTPPWTPLAKPIAECKVALETSPKSLCQSHVCSILPAPSSI
ncbi:MAG: hypothetical protein ACLQBA_19620 [Candidatus Binataceae bacterium]